MGSNCSQLDTQASTNPVEYTRHPQSAPQEEFDALKKENHYLRQQVTALLDVQVPEYFRPKVDKLDPLALKVLSYWFGANYDGKTVTPDAYHLWFGKSLDHDLEISMQFEQHLANTAAGMYDHWCQEPLGVVALVILMDQFPRNIYRNTARAYSFDWKAVVVAQEALKQCMDDRLTDLEKVWIYLVLTHCEDLTSQKLCVEVSETKLLEMDEGFRKMWNMIFYKHLVVIEKFGRFPHRNAFLMRPSTAEEENFVNDPSYRFDLPVELEINPQTGEAKFIFLSGDEAQKRAKETDALQADKLTKKTYLANPIVNINAATRQKFRQSPAKLSSSVKAGGC